MQESKDPAVIALSSNPLLTAVESYKKVYELDAKYEYADECYQKAMVGYRNLGIMSFNKNDFNGALSYFESTTELAAKKGVVDTSAIENSAIAAMRAGNAAKSQQYLKQLIGYNTDKDGTRYLQLIRVQKEAKDTAASLKTLAEGRQKFPNDQKLLTEELNNYLQAGKSAEAEKLLAIAIEKDPTNHLLHYASGTIFEDLNKRELAIAAYKKAIELSRKSAREWEQNMDYFKFNYKTSEQMDTILFKGFEHSFPINETTNLKRLYYDRTKPYERFIPYYCHSIAKDSVVVPKFYVVGAQEKATINRLLANNIKFQTLKSDSLIELTVSVVADYKSNSKPYEGHFKHREIQVKQKTLEIRLKKGNEILLFSFYLVNNLNN
jgi:tetratricopeptide (TPR) repeat protein